MIDVSPFIQVMDFVDARKLIVTAYKNLAVLEFGLPDDTAGSGPIYALTRSVNKNIEYYNEIYFSQAYGTYRNVSLRTFENIGVSYNEEYGYVGLFRFRGHYFAEYSSLDTPVDRFAYAVDKNLWNNAVVTDNNGVVWRGWLCKNRPHCSVLLLREEGIRPSARALGEIVTFQLGGQEIDVGPIYFHHYEQDASDKKRVRVFGWTEFPEGDPKLVQEIHFD